MEKKGRITGLFRYAAAQEARDSAFVFACSASRFHPRLLRFVQPHAQLGAAPDGVVQLYDPLFVGQVAQFGFIQTVAEIFAQIAEAVGTGGISSLWLP